MYYRDFTLIINLQTQPLSKPTSQTKHVGISVTHHLESGNQLGQSKGETGHKDGLGLNLHTLPSVQPTVGWTYNSLTLARTYMLKAPTY